MADMIISVDYDITKAEAKQNKLNREFEISQKETEIIKDKINDTKKAIDAESKAQADITDELKAQINEAADLEIQLERIKSGNASAQEIINFGSISEAENRLQEMYTSIQKNEQSFDKSANTSKKLNSELQKQNLLLDKQKAKTASIGDKIKLNTDKSERHALSWLKTNKNIKRSQTSVARFGRRLKELVKSALIFSVLTKALTALRESFGELLNKEGTKTAQLIAKLKGNLKTLGVTFYEGMRPYIEWLLQRLIEVTQILTNGLAKILGKNVKNMSNLAKSTEKTAKAAKKATASFDTLQTIDTSPNEGDSHGDSDFTALDQPISDSTAAIMAIVSGALLVLGVILVFSGVNIPLGLGLIVAGAVGLAAVYGAKWDTLPTETKGVISAIIAIGGGFFILLGLILILTGVGIPLGIGLILLGAGMLYASYAMSPGDGFVEKITNLWENVKNVTQTFLNWWKEKVINKVFGIGMSETIQDMYDNFTEMFENIIGFFVGVFTGDWDKAWKSLVNIVINILNLIISNINNTIQFFLGGGAKLINLVGKAFGKNWNLNANWAKIPTIPRLATGAVIPGGSPFLAMLGDQRRGQTNIEAPLDTLIEAFRQAREDTNVNVHFTGSLSQLGRVLQPVIVKENRRSTIF